MKMPKPPLATR